MATKPQDCIGHYYELMHSLTTPSGDRIPAGAYVKVVDATLGKVTFETERCTCCGLSYKYTVTQRGKFAALRPLGDKPPFRGSEAGC